MAGDTSEAGRVEWFAERFEALVGNVTSFIRGKDDVVRKAVLCLCSEGHLLIEDVPGVGKTSLARALSSSFEGSMRRIQFTPDLLPSDVLGVQVYDTARGEFTFHPGAVFANIVIGDEINRASPKTQSALLECMEERQVTVDGVPYAVPRPFIVLATLNPLGDGGTYALPQAQVDRFQMRVTMGYPGHEAERDVLISRASGETPEHLQPVLSAADLVQMIEIASRVVYAAPAVVDYVVTLVSATRTMSELVLGVSPRGAVGLLMVARAQAASQGRAFVTAQDVKAAAPAVLAHRMVLQPDAELQGHTADELVRTLLASIPVPQQRVEA
ncbi:AAA family ATPase [Cellulomonas fimi]|uniref:AAA family ATPase n=1 Tax=Cellulomonas fimi TaxID=1708 RepID=UPI002359D5FC|nr:MoxR family ATPase [Cellulomonas fimi]